MDVSSYVVLGPFMVHRESVQLRGWRLGLDLC